jgi:hypothetical protein
MDIDVFFPTPFEDIDDPTNDNVDVCVTTADGESYTLVFITPDNLKSLMESNHEDFISPSFKYIVVKRIDEGTIRRALDEILRDPALLSYYGKD